LAYQRHFPAINWLKSYSLYLPNLDKYMRDNVADDYWDVRADAMSILQEESKLEEIVRLVGPEALSFREKLILLTAKSIREDFLYQDSFSSEDAYTMPTKQYQMLKTIISLYKEGLVLADREEFDFKKIENHPMIHKIAQVKTFSNDEVKAYEDLRNEIIQLFASL